ncbi:GIP, partial [Symbiodinium sp. CCMP2456]
MATQTDVPSDADGQSREQAEVSTSQDVQGDPWGTANQDPWGGAWTAAWDDASGNRPRGDGPDDRGQDGSGANQWDWPQRSGEWGSDWRQDWRWGERWTGGRWEDDNGSSTTAGDGSWRSDTDGWRTSDHWENSWTADRRESWHNGSHHRQPRGDDWSEHPHEPERRGAPSEKMAVPSFTADAAGDELGSSARSYLRQVDAWCKVTRTPPEQRALMLYQHLSGRAWVESEELNVETLCCAEGVENFRRWIQDRYQEVEVSKIAEALTFFFKRLRRAPGQTVREFNSSFDRAYTRLLEIDCRLPGVARAWAYLNAMGLTSSEELALLASVGNDYDPCKLQKAAIMHEKSLKGPWQFRRGTPSGFEDKRKISKNYLTGVLEDDEEDEQDDADLVPEELAYELHEAFVAQEAARAKYKDFVKSPGYDGDFGKNRGYDGEGPERGTERTAAERLKLAKSRSYCAGCKRRGHWHRDAECPLNRPASNTNSTTATSGNVNEKTKEAYVTHVAYVVGEEGSHDKLLAITDCACSKTVAGQGWLEAYTRLAREAGLDVPLHRCDENFRFGASKVFHASFLATVLLNIGGHSVLVRVAIVNGDVPMLLSRTVLAKLGMIYNMAHHSAVFTSIGVDRYYLRYTDTKHPALPVEPKKPPNFEFPSPQEWGDAEIKIASSSAQQYTAFMLSDSCVSGVTVTSRILFPKKVNAVVYNMLTADVLNAVLFADWWSETKVSNDFWIESPEAFYRIHVANKKELVELAHEYGITVYSGWTVGEIRHLIQEHKRAHHLESEVPKGLGNMTLAELQTKATELQIPYNKSTTKGYLQLKIRENTQGADEEVVTFGRCRNHLYREVPEDYLEWAQKEVEANTNASNELRRLATWAGSRGRTDEQDGLLDRSGGRGGDTVRSIRAGSVVNVEMVSGDGRAATPQAEDEGDATEDPRSYDRAPGLQGGTERMQQEIPPEVQEELAELTTRTRTARTTFILAMLGAHRLGDDLRDNPAVQVPSSQNDPGENNISFGPDGILLSGGAMDAGNVSETEIHDNVAYHDLPEYVGYIGDRAQNESIEEMTKRLRKEKQFEYVDCQELLRRLTATEDRKGLSGPLLGVNGLAAEGIRKALWKNALKVYVLFAVMLSAVCNVPNEIYGNQRWSGKTVILEVGGEANTCAAAELGKDVAESFELPKFEADAGLHRLRGLPDEFTPLVFWIRGEDETLHILKARVDGTTDEKAHGCFVAEHEDKRGPGQELTSARAISFPNGVPGHVESSLARLRQNLGHPSVGDRCRYSRYAGAKDSIVKAVLDAVLSIDEWEQDDFEYFGSHTKITNDRVYITQPAYTANHLFQIEVEHGQQDRDLVTTEQAIDTRCLVEALRWLAPQTRPDLRCSVPPAQQLREPPTVSDIKLSNATARKAVDFQEHGLWLKNVNLNDLEILTFHDTGWVNTLSRYTDDDLEFTLPVEDRERGSLKEFPFDLKEREAKKASSKVANQFGFLLVTGDSRCYSKDVDPIPILNWDSSVIQRVSRSTFTAETMACTEGVEAGQLLRSYLHPRMSGRLHHVKELSDRCVRFYPDCKSLYDSPRKEGAPRISFDKRFATELAALRQSLDSGRKETCFLFHWLPTRRQLDDKPLSPGTWWAAVKGNLA